MVNLSNGRSGTIVQQLFLVRDSSDYDNYYFGLIDEPVLKQNRSPAYVTSMIVPSKMSGGRRTRRNKQRATRRRRA